MPYKIDYCIKYIFELSKKYDKNDERVLFQDIRNISTHLCDGRLFEVKPDVQADFTNMPY